MTSTIMSLNTTVLIIVGEKKMLTVKLYIYFTVMTWLGKPSAKIPEPH